MNRKIYLLLPAIFMLALHAYSFDKDGVKAHIDNDEIGTGKSPTTTTTPTVNNTPTNNKPDIQPVLDPAPINGLQELLSTKDVTVKEKTENKQGSKQTTTSIVRIIDSTDKCSVELAPKICAAKEHYINAVVAKFKYDAHKINHRQRVFEWQHSSTVIMFWVVMAIVVIGLVLACFQFYLANKASKKMKDTGTKEQTEINITLSGVQVKSSLVGLLIFLTSIAFLFMYLKFVYPIEKV